MSEPLKLYLLENDLALYPGRYEAAVVAATSEQQARMTHPSGGNVIYWDGQQWAYKSRPLPYSDWRAPDKVRVKLLGLADPSIEPGVVYASQKEEDYRDPQWSCTC